MVDAYFGDFSCLEDDNETSQIIDEIIRNNNDTFVSFNILLRESKTNKLVIAESSDKEKIGKTSNYYEENLKCLLGGYNSYPKQIANSYNYVFISPIYSRDAGGFIGTCEMIISFEGLLEDQQTRLNTFLGMTIIFLIVILSALFLIIYKIIKQPISTLKNAAILLGEGNLDARVNIESKDEFGELGSTFNHMAEDLKKSRDKVQEYNKILEDLLEQKDEFIGQLGHDLKNPLQPLVGLLPLLIEKEKDSEVKEALEVMNENVEYMKDLIFDTLKLAKLRSDNIKFNFEDINLREETDKTIKSQKTILNEKNIEIDNKIDKNISVWADKLRLSEVFKNLINNAVKYSKENNGKITINAVKQNDEVKIIFKDNGIGMTVEQAKKIFNEFYKADTFTDDYYSTGLGLSICKKIVEKHGGRIWVESPGHGKGSTFSFTLKIKQKINKNV